MKIKKHVVLHEATYINFLYDLGLRCPMNLEFKRYMSGLV